MRIPSYIYKLYMIYHRLYCKVCYRANIISDNRGKGGALEAVLVALFFGILILALSTGCLYLLYG